MLSIIAILQTKIMRRRFQIGMGVNPSLIINKGIYIQHVDGGLYTKENWCLAPGDHHVSYTAYINLDLIDDDGSKVHTEYLILEKTLNFTI